MSNSADRPALPMNTYWVLPGRCAAGEYPGAMGRQEAAYKLGMLLQAGVSHFIDLAEQYEVGKLYRWLRLS